jgi:hypothetical protein
MTRASGLILAIFGLSACADRPIDDLASYIKELCTEYCPDRVACVEDDVELEECIDRCSSDVQGYRAGKCGAAMLANLECLVTVPCDQLTPIVLGALEGNKEGTICHEEYFEVDERCYKGPRE